MHLFLMMPALQKTATAGAGIGSMVVGSTFRVG